MAASLVRINAADWSPGLMGGTNNGRCSELNCDLDAQATF